MLEVGPQFLVPPPGMEPALPALGVQSHNHRTARESSNHEKQRAKRDLKDWVTDLFAIQYEYYSIQMNMFYSIWIL